MAPARGLAFAAAHRVVHRVHGDAPDAGRTAPPAVPPGLPEGHVLVIQVAHLSDHRPAVDVELAHLARRQPQLRVVPVPRHQLAVGARRTRHPGATPREQLHVVDVRAERDVLQRQAVPRTDLRVSARLHLHPDLQAIRRHDVAALAVGVVEQRDARRAVRVVLDAGDAGRDAVLGPAEVDDPIAPLVPAADPALRDVALVVAAAGLVEPLGERLHGTAPRQLREVRQDRVPERRGGRTEFLETHGRSFRSARTARSSDRA